MSGTRARLLLALGAANCPIVAVLNVVFLPRSTFG